MRNGALCLCIVLAACTDFAALDDHLASGGVSGAASDTGLPPPIPASDANPPGSTAGASGEAAASSMEGSPSLEGNSGGQANVAPSSSAPRDAGATPDEEGQGSPADAAVDPPAGEPAPPPGTVRFVSLVADSEVGGSNVACISDFNLLGPDGSLLDRALWRAFADSSEPNYVGGAPPAQAIDADRLSLWHTAWFELEAPPGYPHFLLVDLGAFVQVSGFRYLPRQDSSSGRIAAWRFFASTGSDLGEPVASGVFPDSAAEQTVSLTLD